MLIECRECKKTMSSAAPACPACGCPVVIGGATVTTERTAKRWKKLYMVSIAIMAVSAIIAAVAWVKAAELHSSLLQFVCYLGVAGLVVGIGLAAYCQLMTWWHHE